MDFASVEDNLEAWKEVHQQLMNAVLIAKDSIAIQQAQRRFWLTEINANLTEDGKLTPNSVWKRPAKKRGRTKGTTGSANTTTNSTTTTTTAGTKRKKKAEDDDGGGGKPAKKRRRTTKQKKEEEAAAAAAALAEQEREVEDDEEEEEEDDDDEDEEEDDEEEDHDSKPKFRLSLHLKQPNQDDTEDEDDEETEDEDDDDDDDNQEESFLDQATGSSMAMESGRLSPPDASDPHSYSSFLPGQFPSFYGQQSRGQGMMAPTSFATAQDQDDSDDDTEDDDY